jgi:hypothetical protein
MAVTAAGMPVSASRMSMSTADMAMSAMPVSARLAMAAQAPYSHRNEAAAAQQQAQNIEVHEITSPSEKT